MSSSFRWPFLVLVLLLSPAIGNAQEPLAEWSGIKSCSSVQGFAVELGLPKPQLLACSISYMCPDGNAIACTGASSCVQEITPACRLRCDGVCTRCPNFCEARMYCQGRLMGCYSETGDCSEVDGTIRCGSFVRTCPPE